MNLAEMFALDSTVVTDDGRWVSEHHERIARIIKDYEPTLELAYIPPDKREPGDVPFAVIHRPVDKPAYIVLTADVCDERILEQLFIADNKQGDALSRLDAHNASLEAIKMKEQLDREEEQQEITESIIKSPLNTYKHDGVTYQ